MPDQASAETDSENAVKELEAFIKSVNNREENIEVTQRTPVYAFFYTLVRFFSWVNKKTNYHDLENRFYFKTNCTGCGICEKVCLSNRIILVSGRPQWDSLKPCTHCLACIHFCPVSAIEIKGVKTENKGRYHHPMVTVNDIASQK